MTPLSFAFENRDSQIVNLLLSKGAIFDDKVEKKLDCLQKIWVKLRYRNYITNQKKNS